MRTKILLGMATLLLAGCGSLINGENQTVDVVVKGSPSAFCNFSTSVFRNSGNFPNKLNLERSREPLQAECYGEQNLYKKFEIKPIAQPEGTVGNVANATTFFGLSVDAFSGGLWAYPDPLVVDFRVVQSDKKADWPENKADGPAAVIEKPTPVHMQPVEDEQLNPAIGTRATAKPQQIDAVQIADESKKPAAKSVNRMKPVVSPEDDPAVQKARADEKAKAAAEAKKKAKAKAAAKKKAEEAAKAKAAEAKAAEEKAEALPEVKEEAPEAAAPAVAPAATPPATPPVVLPPVPAAEAAKPAEGAAAAAAPKAQENAAPAKPQEYFAPTPVPAPAPAPAPKTEAGAQPVDADQYLTGDGQ